MDLKGLFDSFYEKLVLRDFLGKVVPGFLFISGITCVVFGVESLHKLMLVMNMSVSVITIGFAWILGCALQGVGEFIPHFGFKKYPPEFSNRKEGYKYWAIFYDKASEREQIQAERLNVIKEACGNTAIAILIVCIIAIRYIYRICRGTLSWYPSVVFFLLGIILAFFLWRMHRDHLTKYGEFVKNTVDFRMGSHNVISGSDITK